MPRKYPFNCRVNDEGEEGGKRVILVKLRVINAELLLADSLADAGAYPSLSSYLKKELTPILRQYISGAREFIERAALESREGTKNIN